MAPPRPALQTAVALGEMAASAETRHGYYCALRAVYQGAAAERTASAAAPWPAWGAIEGLGGIGGIREFIGGRTFPSAAGPLVSLKSGV